MPIGLRHSMVTPFCVCVCVKADEPVTKMNKGKNKTANNANSKKKRPDELALELDSRQYNKNKPKEEDTIRFGILYGLVCVCLLTALRNGFIVAIVTSRTAVTATG